MKKKDLEFFKKLLESERRKILRHLEEMSDNAQDDLQNGSGDSVDIASQEINQASLQKIGKREAYLLKKIDQALIKIEGGDYGTCESCGEDIGVARLTARPVAQLCIDCKTEQEDMERRFSGREKEAEGDEEGFLEEGDEG